MFRNTFPEPQHDSASYLLLLPYMLCYEAVQSLGPITVPCKCICAGSNISNCGKNQIEFHRFRVVLQEKL